MLRHLCLQDVGLARALHPNFGPRLNLITGDNGLGKTLLLDVTWWALTGSWVSLPAAPRRAKDAEPRIKAQADQAHDPWYGSRTTKVLSGVGGQYDGARQSWLHPLSDGWTDALVLYLRVDGDFALWDPARHMRLDGDEYAPTVLRDAGQRFAHEALWNGLKSGDRVVCNGLVHDWVIWQLQRERDPHHRFEALTSALSTLSPHPAEWMRPGEPQRVFVDDAREFPTVELPYGTVPVVYASAGMKRILGLAYLLVWAWNEHREAARLRGEEPVSQLIVLCDEVETHLHPQWQRRIVPSLLRVAEALAPTIRVQLLVTTHAPLVLASVEPDFDPERDQLILLELDANRDVVVENMTWAKRGDAQRWLTSDVFGLAQARSIEAEAAIEAALALMRGEYDALPPGLASVETIDAELRRVLPAQDPFWPRWLRHQEDATS